MSKLIESSKDNFIVLLHLSDIHFKRSISGSPYDLDHDLRNQLGRDAKEVKTRLGKVHAILVTGDIAFAGKAEEYETAFTWLKQLCADVDCPEENVWTTPGNHDVDRSIISNSPILQAIHKELRPMDPRDVDSRIQKYFHEDSLAPTLLLKPIEKYNDFASKFQCNIEPGRLYWEHDLPLNDGSKLRMRGLTSTLVSNSYDDDMQNKLILGKIQSTPRQEDGVEYLILCHHPPQWLKDQDTIEDILTARTRIQLFGHKHRQRLIRIGETLRLSAGAVHPDREEAQWQPRFNFLKIAVKGEKEDRKLAVEVYPRVWSETELRFCPDHNPTNSSESHTYELKIGSWISPVSSPAAGQLQEAGMSNGGQVKPSPTKDRETPDVSRSPLMNPHRKLTYRFLNLPYHLKIQVAQTLELLHDEDKGLQDSELFRRFFRRAKEKKLLAKLWEQVEGHYGESGKEINPFISE